MMKLRYKIQELVKNKNVKTLKSFLLSSKSLCIIALVFLLASLVIKWFDVPLGQSIRSYHLSFLSNRLSLKPQFFPISFATVTVSLIGLGTYALVKDKSWIKVMTGVLAFFIGFLVICKIVLYNSALTEDIYEQNLQVIEMLSFSSQLPPNRGIDPTFKVDIATYTVTDRLYLAWHFLTWGWYFLMISGVIFTVLGLKGRPVKKIITLSLIKLLCITLILFGISVRPILAEYYKSQGEAFLSVQQYKKSFDSFSTALLYNSELINNETFALKYGEACYNLKLIISPYYYLYWGNQLSTLGRTPEAISLFLTANELSKENSGLKRALSKTLSKQGRDYYRQDMPGSAIKSWEKSLDANPEQIENWYYISFVYTKLGMYKNAVSAGQEFTLLSNNNPLVANTYANMGDACYWVKEYFLAREYYVKSRSIDPFTNYRAGRALGGI